MPHKNYPETEDRSGFRIVARRTVCLVALFILGAISINAASPAYDYKVLVRSGDIIGGNTLQYISSPFLSDDGAVLFVSDSPTANAGGLYMISPRRHELPVK